jgi:cyclopropane fatty-acyl-phospholipid synthase-like methyltransferase
MSSTAGADYSAIYDPDTDFDVRYTMATVRRIATRVAAGDRVLELGCATGLMTAHLADQGARVTGVDRSGPYLARARERLATLDGPGRSAVEAAITRIEQVTKGDGAGTP